MKKRIINELKLLLKISMNITEIPLKLIRIQMELMIIS